MPALFVGKLVGDALLAAAFVSYAGPFNMEFRKRLVNEKWLPDLTERQIPLTTGFLPLDMLADESSKVNRINWTNLGHTRIPEAAFIVSRPAHLYACIIFADTVCM